MKAMQLAKYILFYETLCGRRCTQNRLQKLLLRVQEEFVRVFDKPAFEDEVLMNEKQPIVKTVWEEYHDYRPTEDLRTAIPKSESNARQLLHLPYLPGQEIDVINQVLDSQGAKTH